MSLPNLVILDGASSSGKTALAKCLQERLLPTVFLHFSFDHLVDSLPDTLVRQINNDFNWNGVEPSKLFDATLRCATEILSTGNSLILDISVCNEKMGSKIIKFSEGFTTTIIGLECTLETLLERARSRNDRSEKEIKFSYKNSIKFLPHHLIISCDGKTVEKISDEVLHFVSS